MKAVIQRVSRGKVTIDDQIHGEIGRGFVVLLGVAKDDTGEDMDYLVKKISGLRVFEDGEGKMNLGVKRCQRRTFNYFPVHPVCQHKKRKSSKLY